MLTACFLYLAFGSPGCLCVCLLSGRGQMWAGEARVLHLCTHHKCAWPSALLGCDIPRMDCAALHAAILLMPLQPSAS